MNTNEELDTNIQIVKEINDDNQKSANELWLKEKESKHNNYNDKFCQDFYPVIITTSSQQINTAKKICHVCDTSLITLLTNAINELYNLLKEIKYASKENKKELSKQGLHFEIESPTFQYYKNYESTEHIEYTELNTGFVKINIVDKLLQDIEPDINNAQKQLIIFKLTNNKTYNDLLNLNNQLQELKTITLSDIFQQLITYLTTGTSKKDYCRFKLNNINDITKVQKYLNQHNN